MANVLFFYGHKNKNSNNIGTECLSNWYPSTFTDSETNNTYQNNEQYMMANKAILFDDQVNLDKILNSDDPKTCKALGRKVKNFDPQIWQDNCCDIVAKGCYLKFSQNEELKAFLLSTGDKLLVEASPYDKIWGIGLKASDAKKMKKEDWPGKNYLGQCLMNARQKIKEGTK
jgi:ribA/ribD-fused uncharacterized protein